MIEGRLIWRLCLIVVFSNSRPLPDCLTSRHKILAWAVQTDAYRDFASPLPGLESRRLRSFKQAAFLLDAHEKSSPIRPAARVQK